MNSNSKEVVIFHSNSKAMVIFHPNSKEVVIFHESRSQFSMKPPTFLSKNQVCNLNSNITWKPINKTLVFL